MNIQAVIKLSGFCNARCRYCYEWDRLADPTKMPISLIRLIASHFGDIANLVENETGQRPVLSFILHGGEPLALPFAYLNNVLCALRESCRTEYTIGVQTNAFSVSDRVIDLLVSSECRVSISNDVIPGVRLSAGGVQMEANVDRNTRKFQGAGILCGGISVLNQVTAPQLRRVHDYWCSIGVRYRLLPLFKNGGPLVEAYGLSDNDAALALTDLAWQLLCSGQPIDCDPLTEICSIAALKFAGHTVTILPLPVLARSTFVVNTDGGVYDQADTDFRADRLLGNLYKNTMTDIVCGTAVERLRQRDFLDKSEVCGSCDFNLSCSQWPLLNSGRRAERCGVTYLAARHVFNRLSNSGLSAHSLRQCI